MKDFEGSAKLLAKSLENHIGHQIMRDGDLDDITIVKWLDNEAADLINTTFKKLIESERYQIEQRFRTWMLRGQAGGADAFIDSIKE